MHNYYSIRAYMHRYYNSSIYYFIFFSLLALSDSLSPTLQCQEEEEEEEEEADHHN